MTDVRIEEREWEEICYGEIHVVVTPHSEAIFATRQEAEAYAAELETNPGFRQRIDAAAQSAR